MGRWLRDRKREMPARCGCGTTADASTTVEARRFNAASVEERRFSATLVEERRFSAALIDPIIPGFSPRGIL